SNVVLGVYPSYEEHPLPVLRDAGVKVTLGSDDPPYFGATIEGEYEACAEHMGFGEDDLRDVTRTAIDAAFCDEGLRGELRRRARV
ncbi:MAG: adenosine deaminase, partial [Solirubrobacterales bacterium]